MSDRNSSNKLTMSQKIQQFKDYYLGGTLAVLAVAALIIYMISRFLSPQENAPVLRVAVFDTELSAEAQEEMAQAVRASLNLPDDAQIVIDTGYVSTNTNEYARLSILSADGMVDAVIAGQEAFAELAGFGYFKDLSLYLPRSCLLHMNPARCRRMRSLTVSWLPVSILSDFHWRKAVYGVL